MIFVNDPGDWSHVFAPFDHAAWNGFTPTDAIFPFFLFIVGVAGALSLRRRAEEGASRGALARRALRRGAAIVLVGWALAWFPFTLDRLMRLRIPGVLPRIGLVYALGTLVVLAAKERAAIVAQAALWLLAVHTFLLVGIDYDLTPDGNVQRAVDLAFLKGHLWKKTWDPEGLVGTLSAIATMLTGTLAGLWLETPRPPARRAAGLALAGALGAAAGLLLSRVLPINKNLWTASYVLFSSGLAALVLAGALVLTERRPTVRERGFFLAFGRNPLLAFVVSGLLAKTLLLVKTGSPAISLWRRVFVTGFSWIPNATLASHAFALAMVLAVWVVVAAFDERGIYWKV
jgi:predicted acyltransferase